MEQNWIWKRFRRNGADRKDERLMEQIRLENEQIEVTVNIHGAELRSLKSKADGQEYLWNADAKYWGRTSPVLFPFVGGVKNKVDRHEGKEYPMNQHGSAWICKRFRI